MKAPILRAKVFLVGLTILGMAALASADLQPDREPEHLMVARDLVKRIDMDHTGYNHGKITVTFSETPELHTDCSGFVDALLKHCYGYDEAAFKKWFNSERPTAKRYHDAIVEQTGFKEIKSIKDAQPGDILAIKYYVRKDNTGHVMVVAGKPRKIEPKAPLISGTEQWTVDVIDTSSSGHGLTDTRHAKGKDGKDHDGLGAGVFRVYADADGKIMGYAWSNLAASKFKDPKEEHLVVGRYLSGFKP